MTKHGKQSPLLPTRDSRVSQAQVYYSLFVPAAADITVGKRQTKKQKTKIIIPECWNKSQNRLYPVYNIVNIYSLVNSIKRARMMHRGTTTAHAGIANCIKFVARPADRPRRSSSASRRSLSHRDLRDSYQEPPRCYGWWHARPSKISYTLDSTHIYPSQWWQRPVELNL